MVGMLWRKLARDLWSMRGQALTIALVVAAGVASLVALLSEYDSLRGAQQAYYERSRFADVFVSLKRAPKSVEGRIAELPGLAGWETRVVYDALLDLPGVTGLASGRFVSIPDFGEPRLNLVYLRSGRMPDPARADEAVINEGFATANGFRPGDRVAAMLNGRYQVLHIVGIGLSPEYVYAPTGRSLLPDDRRSGVFWMREAALAAALNMRGAFNNATLAVAPGASVQEVIARLDALLQPYGDFGALPREDQPSHRMLSEEIAQARNMAGILPFVFLAVVAFLVYMTAGRLVAVQREQIAALKAMGFSNATIGLHYLSFMTVIVLIGAAGGIALGAWLGKLMIGMQQEFYRFPLLPFQLPLRYALLGSAVAYLAAVGGALGSVRWVVRLAPAEAMRPPAPSSFHRSWLDRAGISRLFAVETGMMLRHIAQRPVQSALITAGIGCAVGLMIMGSFFTDAEYFIVNTQFNLAQHDDVALTFLHPLGPGAVLELQRMPGVMRAEGLRLVPVRLRAGHRSTLTVLQGIPGQSRLRQPLDDQLRRFTLPAEGVLLSVSLSELLRVPAGGSLQVEVLEGERPVRDLKVAGLVNDMLGTSAYAEKAALNRWMREGPLDSAAALTIDPLQAGAVFDRLKALPLVGAVEDRNSMVRIWDTLLRRYSLGITLVMAALSALIAVGVIYNSARIALSERSWELASLRVLGFTQGEVARILLSELALELALAIPLGFVLGWLGAQGLVAALSNVALYRIPLIITPRVYGGAALVALLSGALSALLVAGQIRRLDLVGVLKVRD